MCTLFYLFWRVELMDTQAGKKSNAQNERIKTEQVKTKITAKKITDNIIFKAFKILTSVKH